MADARAPRRYRARARRRCRRISRRRGGGHYESEHRILHRDGTYRWVRCRGAAVRNATGVATRLAGSLTDITDSQGGRRADRAAEPAAVRRSARARDQAQARGAPSTASRCCVLGLDRFNVVNDSLGLLTADRLLVAVARRLQASLRATDAVARDEHGFTLARLGGDEFTVLLDDITDASDAMRVAERLRAGAAKAVRRRRPSGVHVGARSASPSAGGYTAAEEILRDAAIALHARQGRRRAAVRDLRSGDARRARCRGCSSRPTCATRSTSDAFAVHYQPIVSLRTGDIVALRGAGAVAPPDARPRSARPTSSPSPKTPA